VVGVILPVMPALPFFLASAWSFSKSSPELEAWLMEHPWVGPALVRFRKHRVVPRIVKVVSIASMWGAFGIALAFGDLPTWALATQGVLVTAGSALLLTFPSRVPASMAPASSAPSSSAT
jgi:uncharacterized protein